MIKGLRVVGKADILMNAARMSDNMHPNVCSRSSAIDYTIYLSKLIDPLVKSIIMDAIDVQ